MPDVQELIHQIFWDRHYVEVPEYISAPARHVIMRDLNTEDHNYRLFIKKITYRKALDVGVPDENELLDAAREGDIWSTKDDDIFEKGEEHIEFLESEIKKNKKFLGRVKKLKIEVEGIKERMMELSQRRDELLRNSAEYMSHEQGVYAVLPRIVCNTDGDPLWESDTDFATCKAKYANFIMFLGKELVLENLMSIQELRMVAKAPEWRLLWGCHKEDLSGLFDRPPGNMNLNQKMLVYWSRVYDSVYEDPERPDFDIIDDDEKLDEWIANRDIKREEDKRGKKQDSKFKRTNDHHENMYMLDGCYVDTCTCGADKSKGKGLGETVRHADDCPYGTWQDYSDEERDDIAAQIYGRNNKRVRQIVAQKQNIVENQGVVQEQNLVDRKSREFLGSKTNVIPMHKR